MTARRLTVRAHPGAAQARVVETPDGGLEVWVTARPVDGRANAAVLAAVADHFGLRPSAARLVMGGSARTKVIEIDVPDGADLRLGKLP